MKQTFIPRSSLTYGNGHFKITIHSTLQKGTFDLHLKYMIKDCLSAENLSMAMFKRRMKFESYEGCATISRICQLRKLLEEPTCTHSARANHEATIT